jgi:hypothetical protein
MESPVLWLLAVDADEFPTAPGVSAVQSTARYGLNRPTWRSYCKMATIRKQWIGTHENGRRNRR